MPDGKADISRPSYWKVLSTPSFFPLWIGQLVSQSGDSIFALAVAWYVLITTGSPFYVGLTIAITYTPPVIIGPIAGVYIDKFNRVNILLASNVLQGISTAVLSSLYLAHFLPIYLLLAFVFIIYSGAQFIRPTVNAMIPSLITERTGLAPANSLFSFSSYFNNLLGFALGGIIVAFAGISIPITYDSLSFFFAAGTLLFVSKRFGEVRRIPEQPERPETREPASGKRELTSHPGEVKKLGFKGRLVDGFRFIKSNRVLSEMLTFGIAVNFFAAAIIALLSPYSRDWLHGGADVYGLILAANSLGGILGAALFGKINVRNYPGKLLLWGVISGATCLALMGLTAWFPVAFILMLMFGFMVTLGNLPIQVLIQAKVPRELLGRVSTAFIALITVTQPFASVLGGLLAVYVALGTIFIMFGSVIALVAIFAYIYFKDFRNATY